MQCPSVIAPYATLEVEVEVEVDVEVAVDVDLFRIETAAKSRSQAGDQKGACLSEASLRPSP
ncbi:hypothetical protein, partial [Actimicrobium sp. CCI2.3]|uniref:hypothetical protein n=1 Tax=Actimicrobium sp. CCI2.3 TaxID=3048616 RepID=UPI002B246328